MGVTLLKLKNRNKELQNKEQELNNTVKGLQDEKQELSEVLSKKDEELKNIVEDKNQELDKLDKLDKEIKELRNKNNELQNKERELNNTVEDLQNENKVLNEVLLKRESDLRNIGEYKNQALDKLNEEIKELWNKNNELNKALLKNKNVVTSISKEGSFQIGPKSKNDKMIINEVSNFSIKENDKDNEVDNDIQNENKVNDEIQNENNENEKKEDVENKNGNKEENNNKDNENKNKEKGDMDIKQAEKERRRRSLLNIKLEDVSLNERFISVNGVSARYLGNYLFGMERTLRCADFSIGGKCTTYTKVIMLFGLTVSPNFDTIVYDKYNATFGFGIGRSGYTNEKGKAFAYSFGLEDKENKRLSEELKKDMLDFRREFFEAIKKENLLKEIEEKEQNKEIEMNQINNVET